MLWWPLQYTKFSILVPRFFTNEPLHFEGTNFLAGIDWLKKKNNVYQHNISILLASPISEDKIWSKTPSWRCVALAFLVRLLPTNSTLQCLSCPKQHMLITTSTSVPWTLAHCLDKHTLYSLRPHRKVEVYIYLCWLQIASGEVWYFHEALPPWHSLWEILAKEPSGNITVLHNRSGCFFNEYVSHLFLEVTCILPKSFLLFFEFLISGIIVYSDLEDDNSLESHHRPKKGVCKLHTATYSDQ